MKWTNTGPELSDEAIERYERGCHIAVPKEIKWFLTNTVNGGEPTGELLVPVKDLPLISPTNDSKYQSHVAIHGIFGVGHPEPRLSSIRRSLDFGGAWTLGFDPQGGLFVYLHVGKGKGEVRYIPWDQLDQKKGCQSYLITTSLPEFARMLQIEPT